MNKDNRIVCDLTKVQWARFGYRNQWGDWRDTLSIAPSVRNQHFSSSECVFGSNFIGHPAMTLLDYAMQNHLLDVWTPELKLKVTANCTLVYTGDKAKSLYKAFCERQFKQKTK